MTDSEYRQLIDFLGRQFEAIDRRFDANDQQFLAMTERLAAMDQRLDAHDRQFMAIAQRFDAVDRRAEALAERVDAGFRDVLGHFDELYRRLERLEQEYQFIVHALRRIEGALADDQGRREVLERGMAELREQVALLKARLDDLDHRIRG